MGGGTTDEGKMALRSPYLDADHGLFMPGRNWPDGDLGWRDLA